MTLFCLDNRGHYIVRYNDIGTNRKSVKSYAETNVCVSNAYWDEQMADAVAAAWSVRER